MENIEKKLIAYSLYDKNTETFNMLVVGYDDKESIDYYLNGFNDINKALSDYYKGEKLEAEKAAFIDKIHNSCIYKVAYFDTFKGEFVNDKLLLIDLFDFKFKEDNKKNENNS